MSEWRSMQTAPMNGKTRVDLGAYSKTGKRQWVRVPDCYWHKKAGQWMTKHYDRAGFSALRLPFSPTHWAKIPEPPQ